MFQDEMRKKPKVIIKMPPSARSMTQAQMTRRLQNLERKARAIIAAAPRQMRNAAERNREINANKKEFARTIHGRAATRRAESRAAILRERRVRVSQANINKFKRMLFNVSAPSRHGSTHANQTARSRFNFHNIPTLNRAWSVFTQGSHHPYGMAPYYTVPNLSELTYRRIRHTYARA
jgi:hypothetical protein